MVIVESVGGACCDSEVELLLRDAMVDWNGVGVGVGVGGGWWD